VNCYTIESLHNWIVTQLLSFLQEVGRWSTITFSCTHANYHSPNYHSPIIIALVSKERVIQHAVATWPLSNSEEVGQGHVHKVSNCGVGQRKLTKWSFVMNRSCSEPDSHINLTQQGSRVRNAGSRMQLMTQNVTW